MPSNLSRLKHGSVINIDFMIDLNKCLSVIIAWVHLL